MLDGTIVRARSSQKVLIRLTKLLINRIDGNKTSFYRMEQSVNLEVQLPKSARPLSTDFKISCVS